MKFDEYDYEVAYKAEKINANTDTLSRNPVSQICPIFSSDSNSSLFHASTQIKAQPHTVENTTQDQHDPFQGSLLIKTILRNHKPQLFSRTCNKSLYR